MSIGERLREERTRIGLNQADFAALAGASKRAQLKWEKDESSPTATVLAAFAEAGADVLYIITGKHVQAIAEPQLYRDVPLDADAKIYQGGMVQIAATGFAVAANATAANVTIGRAEGSVDNTGGAAGAKSVRVKRGIFHYSNSVGADTITRTEMRKTVFVVDDQTVAKTDNQGARPAAGRCFDVDDKGVWVEFF